MNALVSVLATYNSFRNQIGYCRMQSYDTVSRSTSLSPPLFADGRVSFGVGLSSINMDGADAQLCGMCLNVTSVKGFYSWNREITEWGGPSSAPFLAMVMDRCPDKICTENFLDFDIYSPLQPVSGGNPTDVVWNPTPCPILPGETIEYLLCTRTTCDLEWSGVIPRTIEYWSLTIRNSRIPIREVSVFRGGEWIGLRRENGWVWDKGEYDLDDGLYVRLVDMERKTQEEVVTIPREGSNAYHGGIIFSSSLQT